MLWGHAVDIGGVTIRTACPLIFLYTGSGQCFRRPDEECQAQATLIPQPDPQGAHSRKAISAHVLHKVVHCLCWLVGRGTARMSVVSGRTMCWGHDGTGGGVW